MSKIFCGKVPVDILWSGDYAEWFLWISYDQVLLRNGCSGYLLSRTFSGIVHVNTYWAGPSVKWFLWISTEKDLLRNGSCGCLLSRTFCGIVPVDMYWAGLSAEWLLIDAASSGQWQDNDAWWLGKNMKRGTSITVFSWKLWRKPREILVGIIVLAETQTDTSIRWEVLRCR